MSMYEVEPQDSRLPEVHLTLNSDQVKLLEKLKPGKPVKVAIIGRVMSMSQGLEVSEDTKRRGSLCVEIHSLDVMPNDKSPFEVLAEDDD